jgi:uncharacterized protein (TIGR00369 family)
MSEGADGEEREAGARLIRRLYPDAFLGGHAQALGVRLTALSGDCVRAKITLSAQHHQPMGIVHGGVYCALIEEICSMGAFARARANGRFVVGLDNTTSFLKATRSGTLSATAKPLAGGNRTQLWEANVWDELGALVATGRVRLLGVDADFVSRH